MRVSYNLVMCKGVPLSYERDMEWESS